MTEIGEDVFAPQPPQGPKEDEDSQRPISIRLLLFFDGTANNRTNTNERLGNSELYHAFDSQWIKIDEYASYENAHTNVALLESNLEVETPPEGFDYAASVYIEGPGTVDRESDRRKGLAIGTGETGIERKVERGLDIAIGELRKIFTWLDEDTVLEKLSIDLFGFSRGAAGARNCIHALTDQTSEPLDERLEADGFPPDQIEVNFVGLFDTVSSHGLSFKNDVGKLKLDAISRAKRVIQLEASEEYRKNFAITGIDSAGKNGRRICLPGAHSDVGGGYRPGPENRRVFRGNQWECQPDKEWLLAQGWYRPDELTVQSSRDTMNFSIDGERENVETSYSKIPLALMADFIKEEGMRMTTPRFSRLIDLAGDSEELRELQRRIQDHVDSEEKSLPSHWQGPDSLLYIIRNQYLHFSAHYSKIGMAPRLRNGQRRRKYYAG